MKSKLMPASTFAYWFLRKKFRGSWDYTSVSQAIRERDRQWERMLAGLYVELKKERYARKFKR